MASLRTAFVTSVILSVVLEGSAHEHHEVDVGPYEQNFVNEEDIDSALKWHIGIQVLCWGLLFPIGMVLGITKSRWHVPVQVIGTVLTLFAGNYLGHHHAGRQFHVTAHSMFASYLWWYLVLQASMGIFLKFHVMEGSRARRVVAKAHGIVGKTFPIAAWVQMIFGGIATLGFCFGEHFGQCLAHFIMGSAFIGYAMILLLMLRVGAGFLARRKWSQEYLDSWVIMVWGIVNTFTEHDFLRKSGYWSHKDMQHVSLGVLWWAGGALGIFLGRKGQRNVVPAVIIAMTGFAMSAHAQSLEFSTTIHKLFGFSLMSAGLARVVEICFVLKDQPSPLVSRSTGRGPAAFQHLTPYLLVLSGLTFLSATEEQMQWVAGSGMDSTTYANILFSTAFLIYLVGVMLLDLYERISSEPDVRREVDLEGGGGRSWHGIPIPSPPAFFAPYFPGSGRRLGLSRSSDGQDSPTRTGEAGGSYEPIARNATVSSERSPSNSMELSDRSAVIGSGDETSHHTTLFALEDGGMGGDEDEDVARGDDFWEDKEKERL